MRHRLEFVGWLLFLFSAFGFTIESWLSRSWWALAGSVLFLFGVIVFLIPAPPTVRSADAVLSAALPDDPLASSDELLTAVLADDPRDARAEAATWLADGTARGDVDSTARIDAGGMARINADGTARIDDDASSWSDDDGVVEPVR